MSGYCCKQWEKNEPDYVLYYGEDGKNGRPVCEISKLFFGLNSRKWGTVIIKFCPWCGKKIGKMP